MKSMGNAIFPSLLTTSLNRFSKTCTLHSHCVGNHTVYMQTFETTCSKGGVCVKLSSSGVYFFSFFYFHAHRYCFARFTDNRRQWLKWRIREEFTFLYGLAKKNWNSPLYSQKCENLHYGLWRIWRAITGQLKDTCNMFAPNRNFRGFRAMEQNHSNFS